LWSPKKSLKQTLRPTSVEKKHRLFTSDTNNSYVLFLERGIDRTRISACVTVASFVNDQVKITRTSSIDSQSSRPVELAHVISFDSQQD